jgi:hypothetical protein
VSETGFIAAIPLGVALLKEIGIFVVASSVAAWLLESETDDSGALDSGWIADTQRALWADRYQYIYDSHKGHLSASADTSLRLSVQLAKKAVLEPGSVVWEGGLLWRGLQAKAAKLMALEGGSQGSPDVQLLPEVEWTGAGFDLEVGGDDEPQAAGAASVWWVLAGILGLGAAVFAWRAA